MLLLLLACDPSKDEPAGDDTADTAHTGDTDDSGDTGDSTDTEDSGESGGDNGFDAYECGEVPEPPTLGTDRWEMGGDIPASNFTGMAGDPDGTPIYLASMLTGVWRSDSLGEGWQSLRTTTTHIMSDIVVSPDDPDTLYMSSGGVANVSYDGGNSWSTLPLGDIDGSDGSTALVYAIAVAPYDARRIYGVVSGGDIYVSEDAGASFDKRASLAIDIVHNPTTASMNHFWRILPDTEPGGTVLFTEGMSLWTSSDGDLRTWEARFASPVEGRSLIRDPLDPDHVLVGAIDGLYESTDGARTFTRHGTPMQPFAGAWAADGSWLALAARDGVYVSDNGGRDFDFSPVDFIVMPGMGIYADRLFLGWNNGMMVSDDRGQTWTDRSDGLTDGGMSVVQPHPKCANRVWAASRCSGGLYESIDYGSAWDHEPFYFHYVMGVHWDPDDLDRVWVVSDDTVALTTDGGHVWEYKWTQYHFHGFAIDPRDSDRLLLGSVASGSYSDQKMSVYLSEDGGETWTDSSTGIPDSDASAHALHYWPGNPDVVLLGTYKAGDESHQSGHGIGLFRSTDRGASWEEVPLDDVDVAWFTDSPDGVAMGTESGLWHSSDEGLTWEAYPDVTGPVIGADFLGDVGLALTGYGEVFRTDDGGASWYRFDDGLRVTSEIDSWLGAVAIDPSGRVAWVTDYPNGVYRVGL